MIHNSSHIYLGFSHAQYLENDPVQYDFTVEEIYIQDNQSPHYHDNVEFLYVMEGTGTLSINHERFPLSKGSLVMLMPYHVHSLSVPKDPLKIYHCEISLGLLLFSSISRAVENNIAYSLAHGKVIANIPEEEQNHICQVFQEIIMELDEKKQLSAMVALSCLIKIILLYCRYVSNSITDSSLEERNICWKLMQYLNEHFSSDITSKTLSMEFSMSTLQINTCLYKLTGENLADNLHRIRILYACSMLQFDQISSNYIGKFVGYKNHSTFYRKFKELKHMTPEEYRKSHIPSDPNFKCINSGWKIVLYVYEHYTELLTENSIAQALFLSPETIQNELALNFNMTLAD